MGNKFKISDDVRQTLLASFDFGASKTEIDPTRDFLTVGTPRDSRSNVKFDVSTNDLK